MSIELAWAENVLMSDTNTGLEIKCKHGLWFVNNPDTKQAISQALHCFDQFYKDGLYNDTPVSQLGLSRGAYNCLMGAGIDTLSKLVALGHAKTHKINGLGRNKLGEIETMLGNIDYDLVWDWYRVDETKNGV